MNNNTCDELKQFRDTLNIIIEKIRVKESDPHIEDLNNWIKELFDYNVVNGKLNRGLIVVKAFQMISNQMKVEIKDEEKLISCIVGWILEILQTFAVIV